SPSQGGRFPRRRDALQVGGLKRHERCYLYLGHLWSSGRSAPDVTSLGVPEVRAHRPSPTPSAWRINLPVADDLLMLSNERIIGVRWRHREVRTLIGEGVPWHVSWSSLASPTTRFTIAWSASREPNVLLTPCRCMSWGS